MWVDLERAALTIHLLGAESGLKVKGHRRLPQIQYEFAAEAGKGRRIPRIVWLGPEGSIDNI